MIVSLVALAVAAAFLMGGQSAAGTDLSASAVPVSGRRAYVYRWDPNTASFGFTLTLPTGNADPTDVTVVQTGGHQEVWFTESGADKIGRLSYTNTASYTFQEYTLPAGSRPLNLVSGGGFIWYTAPGANSIGRLDPASRQVVTFTVPTADSYPADLDRTPDGTIWFTEMKANQIGRLVVTSTSNYSFSEYTASTLAGGKPYGIVAVGSSVYFAQTANDKVTRFTPAGNNWIDIRFCPQPSVCIPKEPYKLVLNSLGKVWGTERAGNRVSQYEYGTFPVIDPHAVSPAGSLPTGIAVDASDRIWFTQQSAGQIGRLNPSPPMTLSYYVLPQPTALPSGIAADSQGAVWVVASDRYQVFMPMVARDYNPNVPPFGAQFFSFEDSLLNSAADAGVRWIRMPIAWSSIEPVRTTPRTYYWSDLDNGVTKAWQKGVHLIFTVGGQPSWAAAYPMGPLYDPSDLLEFMSALVERYDGDGVNDAPGSPLVQDFELYNEPDNTDVALAASGGWGLWGHNGTGYAQMLQMLYPVVKAANPRANLVMGGLAMDSFEEYGGPFDRQFLDDVLTACHGKQCFDTMNFHYYPPARYEWEPYGPDVVGKANYVKQRLAAHGFTNIKLTCTEISWGSKPPTDPADWTSPELQDRYVIKAFVRGMAAGLESLTWYTMKETGETYLPGLVQADNQPKSSYWVYQKMASMLAGVEYQRGLTLSETGSSKIEGYVFTASRGCRLDVVWTEDQTHFNPSDDPQLPLVVDARLLRAVDKYGNETWLTSTTGKITVVVRGSPLYLEYCQ